MNTLTLCTVTFNTSTTTSWKIIAGNGKTQLISCLILTWNWLTLTNKLVVHKTFYSSLATISRHFYFITELRAGVTLKKAGFSTKLLFEYKGFILSAAVLSSRVTLDVNIKSFFYFRGVSFCTVKKSLLKIYL